MIGMSALAGIVTRDSIIRNNLHTVLALTRIKRGA
jgi:hypothetical protein